MKPTAIASLDRFESRLSEMTDLHLQATHLPHVRRYHARRRRRLSRGQIRRGMGKPRRCWTLPLHLTDLSQLDSLADATQLHGGWLFFLDWNDGLLGIAEVQRKGRGVRLVSLAIGPSASAQHAIVARFFQSRVAHKDLFCFIIPALHFRAISYVNKATGRLVVVPLYSAIVPLQRGRRYSSETIQEKLKVALDHRIRSARQHAERQVKLRQTRSQ